MSANIRKRGVDGKSRSHEEWRNSHIGKFLLMMKPHRLLWDHRDPLHDNRSARLEVLTEVARNFRNPEVTPHFLERKLKWIITVYKKFLYHFLTTVDYKPPLDWFKFADSFMRGAALASCKHVPYDLIAYKPEDRNINNYQPKCLNMFTNIKWEDYTSTKRRRMHRLACVMVLDELFEEQDRLDRMALRKARNIKECEEIARRVARHYARRNEGASTSSGSNQNNFNDRVGVQDVIAKTITNNTKNDLQSDTNNRPVNATSITNTNSTVTSTPSNSDNSNETSNNTSASISDINSDITVNINMTDNSNNVVINKGNAEHVNANISKIDSTKCNVAPSIDANKPEIVTTKVTSRDANVPEITTKCVEATRGSVDVIIRQVESDDTTVNTGSDFVLQQITDAL